MIRLERASIPVAAFAARGVARTDVVDETLRLLRASMRGVHQPGTDGPAQSQQLRRPVTAVWHTVRLADSTFRKRYRHRDITAVQHAVEVLSSARGDSAAVPRRGPDGGVRGSRRELTSDPPAVASARRAGAGAAAFMATIGCAEL